MCTSPIINIHSTMSFSGSCIVFVLFFEIKKMNLRNFDFFEFEVDFVLLVLVLDLNLIRHLFFTEAFLLMMVLCLKTFWFTFFNVFLLILLLFSQENLIKFLESHF